MTAVARPRACKSSATEVDVRGVTGPRELSELLWPSADVLPAYAALGEIIEDVRRAAPAHGVGTREAVVGQLLLADALEQAMRSDPFLPPELRPGDWPASRTRDRWRETWWSLAQGVPDGYLHRGWVPAPTPTP